MRKLIILIFILNFEVLNAQNLVELEKKKNELTNTVQILNDSLSIINSEINKLRAIEIKRNVADSNLIASVKKDAKIKKVPEPLGEIIATLLEGDKVIILDYDNGYFGVCSKSYCGYMSKIWINRDTAINKFIENKILEKIKLERLKQHQKEKEDADRAVELEQIYMKKFGQEVYSKLKNRHYWIGVTKEMAIVSLGTPSEINKTIGSWGVHEQWVYSNIFLYFENGSLSSYQN
jgi:hypothetical protein